MISQVLKGEFFAIVLNKSAIVILRK